MGEFKDTTLQLGGVMHAYNTSTLEGAEQDYKSEVSLGHIKKTCDRKQTELFYVSIPGLWVTFNKFQILAEVWH